MKAAGAFPHIESEYDIWNLSRVYWAQADDLIAMARYERELKVFRFSLRTTSGKMSEAATEPMLANNLPLTSIAKRLAKAHGIPQPDWLAPSFVEMARRFNEHDHIGVVGDQRAAPA